MLLLEGDSFLFRAAIGILAVLEPRLFFPDRTELLELLKYVNDGLIAIAILIIDLEVKTKRLWK